MAGIDPAQVYDPSLYGEQQIIAQRQALATLLKQNGLSAMPETSSVGGIAGRTSPLQGVAKLVQLLSGQDLQSQVNAQNQGYGQRQAQALQGMFQGQTEGLPQGQAALAAGALQGSVGPTQQNAQSMGSMPPPQTRPGAMQMPGASSQQSLAAYLLNPEAYGKDLAGAISPNDTTRQAMQGNMDPVAANQAAFAKANTDGTILRMKQAGMSDAQIKAAVFGEAAKAAEIMRRPGEGYSNSVTGEAGMVGKIPEGANVTGPPGPNGQVSLVPMPGNNSVLTGNKAATEAGSVFTGIKGPNGPVSGYGSDIFGSPFASSAPANITPQPGVPPVPPVPPGKQGTRTVAGMSPATTAISEEGGKYIAALPDSVNKSKQAVTGLERALSIVESGVPGGPGTAKTVNVAALLNNMGVPLLQGDVNGYQTMQKFLQNSLNQAAEGTGASGSDARFESFSKGQPNAETMNAPALAHAIRYVLSQQDANVARGELVPNAYDYAITKGGLANPEQFAKQQWTENYKPDFFAFNRMSPAEQTDFLRSKGSSAHDWVKDYNEYSKFHGWTK